MPGSLSKFFNAETYYFNKLVSENSDTLRVISSWSRDIRRRKLTGAGFSRNQIVWLEDVLLRDYWEESRGSKAIQKEIAKAEIPRKVEQLFSRATNAEKKLRYLASDKAEQWKLLKYNVAYILERERRRGGYLSLSQLLNHKDLEWFCSAPRDGKCSKEIKTYTKQVSFENLTVQQNGKDETIPVMNIPTLLKPNGKLDKEKFHWIMDATGAQEKEGTRPQLGHIQPCDCQMCHEEREEKERVRWNRRSLLIVKALNEYGASFGPKSEEQSTIAE